MFRSITDAIKARIQSAKEAQDAFALVQNGNADYYTRPRSFSAFEMDLIQSTDVPPQWAKLSAKLKAEHAALQK